MASTNGKVALVTGAGTGIGRAVALALQGEGYDVAITGRRADKLEETAKLAAPKGGRMAVFTGDIGNPKDVATIFAGIDKALGRLDLVFNNAGMGAPAIPMEDISFEQWQAVVSANLTGSFLCAQEAIKRFKAQTPKGGRIINNGSISAHTPRPMSAPYTATKHAITGLTKSIALDGRPHNICCGQIDIGNAGTDMTSRMSKGVPQADGSLKAEPTMDVAHVARAVVHMASLPLETNVLFMTVMANGMPYVGRG